VLEKDIDAMNGAVRLARYIVIYLTLFFLHRSNCEEGEQDVSDEYGHAGQSGNHSTHIFVLIVHRQV
jgi:hypothetical protein